MSVKQYCRELADILQTAMPSLDKSILLSKIPDSLSEDDILPWLYEALYEQQLCEYNEYKEYWGDLPEIKPLLDMDTTAFSPDELCSSVGELVESEEIYLEYGGDVPWFSFQNYFLKPLGVQIVTLEYENVYMFCVRDDDVVIKQLADKFKEVKLPFFTHDPLDLKACVDFLKANNGI